MIVDILNIFRIVAPPTLDLAEGSAYAISVSLSRIEADRDVTVTVTIMNPLEGSGLTVNRSSLTFSSSLVATQFITVDTTTDNTYTGDRSATLTLTADNYATKTVTITILENTLQQIGLKVISSTELNLVRFTSTEIAVRVGVDATLNVETTGTVILVGAQSEYSLTGGADATQIQIRGESVGKGTVTFTVSGDRQSTEKAVVSVTVTQPKLVIRASTSVLNIEADQTTAELTVTVMAVGGHRSTLTAMVIGIETGTGMRNVASVMPTQIENVMDNTPKMFTVRGLAAGTAVLTLTADHPDYDPMSTEILVQVTRPAEALRFRIKVFLEGAQ